MLKSTCGNKYVVDATTSIFRTCFAYEKPHVEAKLWTRKRRSRLLCLPVRVRLPSKSSLSLLAFERPPAQEKGYPPRHEVRSSFPEYPGMPKSTAACDENRAAQPLV